MQVRLAVDPATVPAYKRRVRALRRHVLLGTRVGGGGGRSDARGTGASRDDGGSFGSSKCPAISPLWRALMLSCSSLVQPALQLSCSSLMHEQMRFGGKPRTIGAVQVRSPNL